jgi:hypothetical protein
MSIACAKPGLAAASLLCTLEQMTVATATQSYLYQCLACTPDRDPAACLLSEGAWSERQQLCNAIVTRPPAPPSAPSPLSAWPQHHI